MDWSDLKIFLHVARCRSFSEAAQSLALSVPTIGRRIESLERDVGLPLVQRTARGLVLTDHGRQLSQRGERLQLEVADIDRFVDTLRKSPGRSVVRVSATEPVIAEVLAPRLPALLSRPAAPLVELRVENALAAIALNDADIAIRLARPDTATLMARRLATLGFALYGSPGYVATVGKAGLRSARILAYDDRYGLIAERNWIDAAGLSVRVVARMSSTRGLLAAVAADSGLAVLPSLLADRCGLVPVHADGLPDFPSRDAWLVWHRSLSRHPPTRRVLDWITEAFASLPPRASAGRQA